MNDTLVRLAITQSSLFSDWPDEAIARLIANAVVLVVEPGTCVHHTGDPAKFLTILATGSMIRGYRALVARHKGEVTAHVTVAEKLSDTHLDTLKSTLKTVTSGKDIDLDVKIDPAVIGGLIVKVGSRMVDSSLRTKLNSIKLAMKEAR